MTTLYDLYVAHERYKLLRAALEKYADPDNWLSSDEGGKDVFSPEFTMNMPGYQLAQSALESADKITSKELWSYNT